MAIFDQMIDLGIDLSFLFNDIGYFAKTIIFI